MTTNTETLTREIHQLEQLVDSQAEASEEAMSAEYQKGYRDGLKAAARVADERDCDDSVFGVVGQLIGRDIRALKGE